MTQLICKIITVINISGLNFIKKVEVKSTKLNEGKYYYYVKFNYKSDTYRQLVKKEDCVKVKNESK